MEPPQVIGTHLQVSFGFHKGRVVIDLGKSVSHLEMEPEECEKMAQYMMSCARQAKFEREITKSHAGG